LAPVLATLRHRLQPRLEAAGIQLIWRVDDLPKLTWLTPQSVHHIQRMVLEALSNVIQHAKATQVTLSAALNPSGTHIDICIQDNGVGCDEAAFASRGRGWTNLRDRAAAIGATMQVRQANGCSIEWRLPSH
jgi:signal transduction histidine kinase